MSGQTKNWSTSCLELVLVRLDSLKDRYSEIEKEIGMKQKEIEERVTVIEEYLEKINLILDKKNQFDVIYELEDKVKIMIRNYSTNSKNFLEKFKTNINKHLMEAFENSNMNLEIRNFRNDLTFLDDKKNSCSELIALNNLRFESLNKNYLVSCSDIVESIQIETNKLKQAFKIYQKIKEIYKNEITENLLKAKNDIFSTLKQMKNGREKTEDFVLDQLETASILMVLCESDHVLGSLHSYKEWLNENNEKDYAGFYRFVVRKRSRSDSLSEECDKRSRESINDDSSESSLTSSSDRNPDLFDLPVRKNYAHTLLSESYIDLLEKANFSSCHTRYNDFQAGKDRPLRSGKSQTQQDSFGGVGIERGSTIDLERLSTTDSLTPQTEPLSINNIEDEKYSALLDRIRKRGFEPKTLGEVLTSRRKRWAKTQCIHVSAKEDFLRHLKMYRNQFRSYNRTLDGWIPSSCNPEVVLSKGLYKPLVNRNNSRNSEKMVWSNVIFCPNFRPGGEIIHRFSRKTMKTYNTLYNTIKHGWVHPNLLVCLVRDASHPVRFATPPDQDCYTAIYTGPEISEKLTQRVIFGEYTGIVYREDVIPDSIFEYAFELNFTSASWLDAELEYRGDKQYIRDKNGTIFLPNNSKYVLDSSDAFNELSMVNHCQSIGAYGGEYFLQANCEWQQVIFDGWPHVILTNKQGVKIQTGDELIADFGALWFQKVEENCHRQLKRELISYRLLNSRSENNQLLVQELPGDKNINNLDHFVVNNNTSYVCAICLDEDLNNNPNTSTKKILQHRKSESKTKSTHDKINTQTKDAVCEKEVPYREDEDEDECIVCDGCDRIFHIKCLENITNTALNYIQFDIYRTKFINFQTHISNSKGNTQDGNSLVNLSLVKWYCMYCRYLCKQIIQHDLNQDFIPLQSCIYLNQPPNPTLDKQSSPSSFDNESDTETVKDNKTTVECNGNEYNVVDDKDKDVEMINNRLINLNKITNYITKLINNGNNSNDNKMDDYDDNGCDNVDEVENGTEIVKKKNVVMRRGKRKRRRERKIKSSIFKGNRMKTLYRMKLMNKPTTVEIAKYLIKQKMLSKSNKVNIGYVRLFGNYNLSNVSGGKMDYHQASGRNKININLFNLGLISVRNPKGTPVQRVREVKPHVKREENTSREPPATNDAPLNYPKHSEYLKSDVIDLDMDDMNKTYNTVYSKLLQQCNDNMQKGNNFYSKLLNNKSEEQVKADSVKTTPAPESVPQKYDNSIMSNLIDYLNCRYLIGMWQIEPFSIFGEAVRVCVDCNKKCGPKANVYVCRVLKRHLSGNFDHPKATNVEQMKELILISFEQHINYLLRLLVLKNIVIDFLVKLSCHFITKPNFTTDPVSSSPNTASTGTTTSMSSPGEGFDYQSLNAFSTGCVSGVSLNAANSRIYNNVNEFVKSITNTIKRIPQGDIEFNYQLLKSMGGFEQDFVRIINCNDVFKYINDLSNYMCYNSDQIPSNIQQILSNDELARFNHFRKYLIKDVNLFVNTTSGNAIKNSGASTPTNPPTEVSTSDELDEVVIKYNVNNIIRLNRRLNKLQRSNQSTTIESSSAFIPMFGIKPGKSIVYRKFSDGYYQGLIKKYTNNVNYFKIEYSDGDDELMEPFELFSELVLNLNNIQNILLQLSANDINNAEYIEQLDEIRLIVKTQSPVNEISENTPSRRPNHDITNHYLFHKLCNQLKNHMLRQLINMEEGTKRGRK